MIRLLLLFLAFASPALALEPGAGEVLTLLNGSLATSCTANTLVLGGTPLSCSTTAPSGLTIPSPLLTLSTTSSTTAGRLSYDSATKKMRLGDGSKAAFVDDTAIDARSHLACDGATDDRAAFTALIQSGGAASGKTLRIPDGCTILLSSPGTSSSSGTVATLQSNTRVVFEGSGNIALGTKSCSGGTYPGAACASSAECLGSGTCTDLGQFAPGSTAYTYTLFTAASVAIGIEIVNPRIYVNGNDPFARCNGGSNAGKPCKQTCSGNVAYGCATDAQCSGLSIGTCTNAADCSGAGGSCIDEGGKPSGTGLIDLFNLQNAVEAVVQGAEVFDHRQGNIAIDLGTTHVSGVNGFGYAQAALVPADSLDTAVFSWRGPKAFSNRLDRLTRAGNIPRGESTAATQTIVRDKYRVASGIIARYGALVSGNTVSASGKGVWVVGTDNVVSGNQVQGTAPFAYAFYVDGTMSRISNNRASAWGCAYGAPGSNNIFFQENMCLYGAGPKVNVANGGWDIMGNYLAWGSTPYCTDSTAANYGASCSCAAGTCNGGTNAGITCDGNGDCPSSTCNIGVATYPCYDTDTTDGNASSCDTLANKAKAKCEPLGNIIRIGSDGRTTGASNTISHLRVRGNLLFSQADDTSFPMIRIVDGGPYCSDNGANLYNDCSCGGSYPCTTDTADCVAGAHTCSIPSYDNIQINDNNAPNPATTFVSVFESDVSATADSGLTQLKNLMISNNAFTGARFLRLPSNTSRVTTPILATGNNVVNGSSAQSPIANLDPGILQTQPVSYLVNKQAGQLTAGDLVAVSSADQGVAKVTAASSDVVGVVVQTDTTDGDMVQVVSTGATICAYDSSAADFTRGDRFKISGSVAGTVDKASTSDSAIGYALETKTTSSSGTVKCFLRSSAPTSFSSNGGLIHTSMTDWAAATKYLKPGEMTSNGAAGTTWAVGQQTYVAKGTINRMRCVVQTAPGSSKTKTFTLKCGGNGSSTCQAGVTTETDPGFTCGITGTSATDCTYSTALTVPAGGLVISLVTSATASSATGHASCEIVYTPDT